MMTPCEKLGYKVGDKFEVLTSTRTGFKAGTVLTLTDDDGSDKPRFGGDHPDGDGWGFCCLDRIKPLTLTTPNKSKTWLATALIEAGATKFPEGANWAVQCSKDVRVSFYGGERPKHNRGESVHYGDYCGLHHDVQLPALNPQWHQTVLSRDEFDQFVAETEPDADGWIEWNGGECPVEVGALIDVKYRDLHVQLGSKVGDRSAVELYATTHWRNSGGAADIIAYRLHKPEQAEPQYCESVMRSIPEPTTAPTLDHLLQDWRNADDYAQRKQTEADEAAAMRDERWQAVQARAGEMKVMIGPVVPVVSEPEPNDGWIEWEGGKCPVVKGTFVDIRLRDGREELNLAADVLTSGRNPDASCAFWKHDGGRGDIIAYRLARP